ncbi:UNVERIFIED_ORG: helix-turn-helix protein [Zoogloea ramigera]|uniref:Helix-turn-helix transcriptional regulator n=1 Tax=Duganella zoogloeoides TaxID=75659 RepID=A0ABZ0Y4L5_9BURK|nr:helix-turn-helix transcriptional regulator [Duganella zoogloeoides]WQH06407.1 helix-turn-helix transcriptional regulator [Duganella zoogloeoides]
MTIFQQLQQRRNAQGKTLQYLATLTGMSVPQVSNVLGGKVDARLGTIEALANAMEASVVVIPKHLLPEVERLLSGKAIGPDDVPSSVDRFLASTP